MRSRRAVGVGSLILALAASATPSSAQAPPSAAEAQTAIDRSPRHAEWVSIDCPGAPVKSWVMYPERNDKAPVVIVIHPGPTLDDWTRAIADRLAADGYIAIAPDLDVEPRNRVLALEAVRDYALKIPAASGKVAALGFEQGGTSGLEYAVAQPALQAAIAVSATTAPKIEHAREGHVPTLGLYADLVREHDATAKEAVARSAWARVLGFLSRHLQ